MYSHSPRHFLGLRLIAYRMMPIRPFYLGENPSSPSHFRPQSMSQANLSSPSQRSATSSPTQQRHAVNRQSMPPQRVSAASPPATSPTQSSGRGSAPRIPEEQETVSDDDVGDEDQPGRTRKGTMSKNFRFPSPNTAQPPPPVPSLPPTISVTPAEEAEPAIAREDAPQTPPKADDSSASGNGAEPELTSASVVAPSSVEVPPPPPVDKERPLGSPNELDDDVGETEEISLN